MKRTILLLILIFPMISYGAFEGFNIDIIGDGRANVQAALYGDMTSSFINPASFTNIDKHSISVGYSKLFMMYNHFYVSYGAKTSVGNIGLSYIERDITGDFTDSLNYVFSNGVLESEKGIFFTHNFNIAEHIHAGYNFKLYNISMKRFGSANAISLDFGFIGNLFSTFSIGAAVHNINRPIFGKVIAYYIPANLILGLSYEPYNGLLTSLQFEKEEGYDTRVAAAIDYEVLSHYLTIRTGISTNPMLYSAGFSLKYGKFALNYAYKSQREISDSHEVGISINF
ncbi:hypothetical protein KAU43_03790 [candidate division WOR-3 bacterium]|nr:hypothetical protein [candidate division WOR-3 bacterium]